MNCNFISRPSLALLALRHELCPTQSYGALIIAVLSDVDGHFNFVALKSDRPLTESYQTLTTPIAPLLMKAYQYSQLSLI